jgi:hypothetical protein
LDFDLTTADLFCVGSGNDDLSVFVGEDTMASDDGNAPL